MACPDGRAVDSRTKCLLRGEFAALWYLTPDIRFLISAWSLPLGVALKRKEGHLVDALALRGDEGRGTLRKARGRCERSLIPGSPNGATHRASGILSSIHRFRRRTRRTETSQ